MVEKSCADMKREEDTWTAFVKLLSLYGSVSMDEPDRVVLDDPHGTRTVFRVSSGELDDAVVASIGKRGIYSRSALLADGLPVWLSDSIREAYGTNSGPYAEFNFQGNDFELVRSVASRDD
jgi:hypothetical protein